MTKLYICKCNNCESGPCHVFTGENGVSVGFKCDYYPEKCYWKESKQYQIIEKLEQGASKMIVEDVRREIARLNHEKGAAFIDYGLTELLLEFEKKAREDQRKVTAEMVTGMKIYDITNTETLHNAILNVS